MKINIIIAGSRDFIECPSYTQAIDSIIKKEGSPNDNITIVSGAARGADRFGEKYALSHGYDLIKFPADWDKYGKPAGYIRNSEMAAYATSGDAKGVLIAFWDGVSKGTQHMINTAEKRGIVTHIVKISE